MSEKKYFSHPRWLKRGLLWMTDLWPIVLVDFMWRTALGAPREPKLVKCVISSSFCDCYFKDDTRLRSHLVAGGCHHEKFNIDILAQKYFRSQYTCGEARKKFWDKKSMLNFSRQAHNAKVTDWHALFRILRFCELGCFLGRNIDLGVSFPTHDLKFGQFCDSTKNFGPPKFCWNFSEIIRFFFEQFWKKILFWGHFKRKLLLNNYDFWHFSTHPHIPRVYGKLPKVIII